MSVEPPVVPENPPGPGVTTRQRKSVFNLEDEIKKGKTSKFPNLLQAFAKSSYLKICSLDLTEEN